MGVNIRVVTLSTITRCPHVILDPAHFRQDATCRCDDAEHTGMAESGYMWDAAAHRWR